MIVFDIETVNFPVDQYSEVQKEHVKKKLDQAIARNPDLDARAEEGKIKGTDPYLSRVVCIGMFFPDTGRKLAIINDDEKVLLENFWKEIRTENLFISYNGVKFDVPYLIKRSIKHGVACSNPEFLKYTIYNPLPPHFDVMLQLCGKESFYSLKMACDFFDVPSPKEGAVSSSNVTEAYYSGRIEQIAEYCLRDIESTFQLYLKLKPFVFVPKRFN